MNHWYLVSSLPVLRLGEKPTMSVDAFRAACMGHLSEDERLAVEAVLENREPEAGETPAGWWWNREVQLRDAVVRVRAKNRGSDATPFLKPYVGFSVAIEKQVVDAFSRPNPLEQEPALDRARWGQADELALTAPFGFPGILAFAIKVRIAERWAELDEETGKEKVEELIQEVLTEDRGEGVSSE
jgi:hypothetical protein